MKELAIDKDIVQVLQMRTLTHFGHVNRMHTERYLHGFYMVRHMTQHSQSSKTRCGTQLLTLSDSSTEKHQDWFDDNDVEIQTMLAQTHRDHKRQELILQGVCLHSYQATGAGREIF